MFEKLEAFETKYNQLQEQIADPALMADLPRYRETLKSVSEIQGIVEKFRQWRTANKRLHETREMLATLNGEDELRELAVLELAELESQVPLLEQELTVLLQPKDPNDEKNVFV